MLRNATQVINLKIISLSEGKEVDTVKDVVYDPELNKVVAFLIDSGGWFSDAEVILMEDVKEIGENALMVESEHLVKKVSNIPNRVSNIAQGDKYLTKTRIISEDGKELGTISDIYFDTHSGIVDEFEVSQGIKNLQSGKKRIKVNDIVTIGKDATIVKSYTEMNVEQQGEEQGLNKIVKDAQNKGTEIIDSIKQKATSKDTSNKIEDLKTKVQEIAQTTKDKVTQTGEQTKDKVQQTRIQNAVGTYLTKNIILPNDELLAAEGDMVTYELIEKAKNANILEQILQNTTKKYTSSNPAKL